MNEVKYFVENETINNPVAYKHESDAGMDICSSEDAVIHFGEVKVIHTGLHIQLPEGYEIQVRPRSGLATKGITVVNAPGTIDEGYTGEICVIMSSLNAKHAFRYKDENGEFDSLFEYEDAELISDNGFKIIEGDRIAQLVLAKVEKVNKFTKVNSLDELKSTDGRGSNGFGSTGVK